MKDKPSLTHLDDQGLPGMVDVSQKPPTLRRATATGRVLLPQAARATLAAQDFATPKGSIAQTAIIAATMAVKQTHLTIPLCHQLPVSSCKVAIQPTDLGFDITCSVKTQGPTGVEMEALHGVSVAALTIYDMCKALTHDITITDIQLTHKSGGKSDYHAS